MVRLKGIKYRMVNPKKPQPKGKAGNKNVKLNGVAKKEEKKKETKKAVVNGIRNGISDTVGTKKDKMIAKKMNPEKTKTIEKKAKNAKIRKSDRVIKQFVPFQAKEETKKDRPKSKKTKKEKDSKKKDKVKRVLTGRVTKAGGKKVKVVKVKVPRKKGNDRLVPRPEIVVPSENPALFNKKEYVNYRSLTRRLIGAVMKQDQKEIKNIMEDDRYVYNETRFSNLDRRYPMGEALASCNLKFIDFFLKKTKKSATERYHRKTEPNLLSKRSTGQANFYMLGRKTRAIEASRGGREGNDAFVKYEPKDGTGTDQFEDLVLRGATYVFLEALANDPQCNAVSHTTLQMGCVTAMRCGNQQLAAHIAQASYTLYNALQLAILKNEKLPDRILAASIEKKVMENKNITTAHVAAINPDASYLRALWKVEPQINHHDVDRWSTVHYAAVCKGTGPLNFLLSKDFSVAEMTKTGETPLHVAAAKGRAENVKILLDAIKKVEDKLAEERRKAEEEEKAAEAAAGNAQQGEDEVPKRKKKVKHPVSLVNARNKKGRTPLHMAAQFGRTEVVKVLLADEHIEKEAPISVYDKKLTALMLAIGAGHMDTVSVLIEGGCLVEGKDKLGRSPLIIACMNGQAHIAALLLQKGADVHRKDSSGNTAMLYACAYGWLECAKMLAKVDITTLAAKNDWLLSPLSVAYLKGNYGIVTWLLDSPEFTAQVDINSKDNEGVTLISSLIRSTDTTDTAGLLGQLQFLLDRGADCSIVDSEENSPLHVFCALQIRMRVEDEIGGKTDDNDDRITSKDYKECVDKLIKAGADPLKKNSSGNHSFKIALQSGNLFLASHLYDKYGGSKFLEGEWDEENKKNPLHTLFALPFTVTNNRELWAFEKYMLGGQYNVRPMLDKWMASSADLVTEWIGRPDKTATPPIMQLCTANNSLSGYYMEDNQFKKLKATLYHLIRRCIDLNPSVILFRSEPTDPEEKAKLHEYELLSRPSMLELTISTHRSEHYERSLMQTIMECSEREGKMKELLLFQIVDKAMKYKYSLVHFAIQCFKKDLAIILLEAAKKHNLVEQVHGAAVPIRMEKKGEEWIEHPLNTTVLHMCVTQWLPEVIKELKLTRSQAAAVDADGNTAFHLAARRLTPSTIPMFELLEALQVPLSVVDKEGRTPLHIAVDAEKSGSVDAFLDPIDWLAKKISPKIQDVLGRTVLHHVFHKDGKLFFDKDPIALMSLICSYGDKDILDIADCGGSTPLHFAAVLNANICIVSLLAKGANVNIKDRDGNTPLALALRSKSLAGALTLIQGRADITNIVHGKPVEIPKRPKFTFPGEKFEIPVQEKWAIPELVVRNEWHTLVYVIFDILGKTPMTICKLMASSLQNGQHNFSIYLLKLLGDPTAEVMKAFEKYDILCLFVDSITVGDRIQQITGPVETVLQMLWDMGVDWVDGKGASTAVERALEKQAFDFINLLKNRDKKKWKDLVPSSPGFSPVRSMVERWISQGDQESVPYTKWFDAVLGLRNLSIDELISAPKLALPGYRFLASPPEYVLVTPLTRAVQAQHLHLVQYLLNAGADPNIGEVPPLLVAITTNNLKLIKMLVDIEFLKKKPEPVKDVVQVVAEKKKKRMGRLVLGQPQQNDEESDSEEQAEEEENEDEEMEEDHEEPEEEEEEEQEKELTEEDEIEAYGKQLINDLDFSLKHTNKRLNLNIKDAKGRNILHYMVDPCGFQNIYLLKHLEKCWPELKKMVLEKDKSGETPIALAARLKQRRMLRAMRELLPKPPTLSIPSSLVVPPPTSLRVTEDMDAYLKQVEESTMDTEEDVDNRAPHENSGYRTTGQILYCEETKQLFKILLNKTDLRTGLFGYHNFYIMELIKRKDADLFLLFTNWGRIGDSTGEFQCTPFKDFELASKEFKSVWKQKTGNEWVPFDQFVEKKGKYRLIRADNSAKTLDGLDISFKPQKSKDPVYNFFADISEPERLIRYSRDVKAYGAQVHLPFGKVHNEDIERASKILQRLVDLATEVNELRRKISVTDTDALLQLLDQQMQLTSEFYQIIPIGGCAKSALHVLGDFYAIQQAQTMMNQIREVEVSGRLLAAASLRANEDPIRYIMEAVECPVVPVKPEDPFAQRVIQWIRCSRENYVIREMFSITPRQPTINFQKHEDCENMTYLWHGTRAENILPILSQGLLVQPSSAMQCGDLYGKGVYFADSFTKSAGYCHPSSKGSKYMLISKVALGKISERADSKKPFDTLLVKGGQSPSPAEAIVVNGAIMPIGQVEEQRWGNFSEYIVKDPHRIMPCYIVEYVTK